MAVMLKQSGFVVVFLFFLSYRVMCITNEPINISFVIFQLTSDLIVFYPLKYIEYTKFKKNTI